MSISKLKVVVHDGAAHSDDFLSCCILLYLNPNISIYRRPPTIDEFSDPSVYIVDQGRDYNPVLNNFDHHQLNENICSFTQILDHFYGLEYREYNDWAVYIETFDASGPVAASKFIGGEQLNILATTSPITSYILSEFGNRQSIVEGDYLRQVMFGIGGFIHNKITTLSKEMDKLDHGATIITKTIKGKEYKILSVIGCDIDMSFTPPVTKTWCKKNKIEVDIILADNTRGDSKYRMVRINDSIVFKKLDIIVEFVHQTGFLCCFYNIDDIDEILEEAIQ